VEKGEKGRRFEKSQQHKVGGEEKKGGDAYHKDSFRTRKKAWEKKSKGGRRRPVIRSLSEGGRVKGEVTRIMMLLVC